MSETKLYDFQKIMQVENISFNDLPYAVKAQIKNFQSQQNMLKLQQGKKQDSRTEKAIKTIEANMAELDEAIIDAIGVWQDNKEEKAAREAAEKETPEKKEAREASEKAEKEKVKTPEKKEAESPRRYGLMRGRRS